MVARFFDGQVVMSSSVPGSEWMLEIQRTDTQARLSAWDRRVEYQHDDGVLEWYENNGGGLQHGFEVPASARPDGAGRLRMKMEVRGLTVSEDPASPDDLCFNDSQGRALAAYRGLKAWDARGRELVAEMHPASGGFEIAVNDRDAIYPLRIDPYFLNLEQLIMPELGGTASQDDRFGTATALDGDTAVVTAMLAYSSLSGTGRAYVFAREGSAWHLQAELWPDDCEYGDQFGNSVVLDGDTLAIGSWKSDQGSSTSYAGSVYVFERSGQAWTQQQKLTAPTPKYYGQFGISLSLDGDELLVGSYSGGAYLFSRSSGSWLFRSQPQPSTGSSAAGFGQAVAIDGDRMVVGAPREAMGVNSQVGAAYVFARSGEEWVQTQRIASPYTSTESRFAEEVALDGDTVVIGSPYADYGITHGTFDIYRMDASGSFIPETINPGDSRIAYMGGALAIDGDTVLVGCGLAPVYSTAELYQRTGNVWNWSRTFQYGSDVALDGSRILLGAHNDPGDGNGDNDSYYGAAFIYELEGPEWVLGQRLTMGNRRAGAGLGSSIAMQGDTLAVGARSEPNPSGSSAGAVYVFARSSGMWQLQSRLASDSTVASPYFALRLALDGDTLAVSSTSDAHTADTGTETSNVGSVSVFTRDGDVWSRQQKLYAEDFASSDGFGTGLALQGDHLLVGSPNDSDGSGSGQSSIGSVYWFERSGDAWTQQSKIRSGVTRDSQRFGCSIAIDGDTAIIGAHTLISSNYYAGRAFVFTHDGSAWNKQATLNSPTPGAWIHFGGSVAISGDTVLVASTGTDMDGVSDPFGTKGGIGRAHVFTRSGTKWSHQAAFDPDGGDQSTAFGKTLEVQGNTAVIGKTGGVELFTRSGTSWTRQAICQSVENPDEESFGSALALDGSRLAVGSSSMDLTLDSIQKTFTSLGAVEVFDITTDLPGLTITSPSLTSVSLPDTSCGLRLTAVVDPHGSSGTPSIVWSKLSGPGSVDFISANSADSSAIFSAPGTYVIQCAATVGGKTSTRTRMVIVGETSVMTFREGENGYLHGATTLRKSSLSVNQGASEQLLVGGDAVGPLRSVLYFDLKALPATAVVHEVSLETTTSSTPGGGVITDLELWLMHHTFTEGTGGGGGSSYSGASWNRSTDLADNTLWEGGNPSGDTPLTTLDGFDCAAETSVLKTFPSTPAFISAAQSAVVSGRLNLLLMAPASEDAAGDHFARFHSDDAAGLALRPQLRITYSVHPAPVIDGSPLTALTARAESLSGRVSGANSVTWSMLEGPGMAVFTNASATTAMVTFDQPGSYVLGITAANEYGELSDTISVEVEADPSDPAVYSNWQQLTWPGEATPSIIGPAADPDHDGLSNLLEWALHLDATSADAAFTSLSHEGCLLSYRYTRRILPTGAATFQIECSDDLATGWNPAEIQQETITPLTATEESVLVTLSAGDLGRRFVRLKVSQSSF
ncbi:MAG: hypothetical protein Q7R22_016100 [Verrucomicrobiota bacterium JB025]|nr:hypothetical protein [Verrucomicrobiota bacterium JB025]